MRTLVLLATPMTGADVLAWQKFLTGKGLYNGPLDGAYGSSVMQASKAYQAKAKIGADGVVGAGTYAQALLDGFEPPAGTIGVSGMDASAHCGGLAKAIAGTGRKFVGRYYSLSPVKNLTLAEARALTDADLQIVTVYEDGGDHLGFFQPTVGTANAKTALQQAGAIGQPEGSAIYFAVDFNPGPADVSGAVTRYFQEVAAVFSAATKSYGIGVYGSGLTCRMIRDAQLAGFTWLSNSTGFLEWTPFRPQADILQAPTRNILNGQLNIDDDIGQTADFGAFSL